MFNIASPPWIVNGIIIADGIVRVQSSGRRRVPGVPGGYPFLARLARPTGGRGHRARCDRFGVNRFRACQGSGGDRRSGGTRTDPEDPATPDPARPATVSVRILARGPYSSTFSITRRDSTPVSR